MRTVPLPELTLDLTRAAPVGGVTDGLISVALWENPDRAVHARTGERVDAANVLVRVDVLDLVHMQAVRDRLVALGVSGELLNKPDWIGRATAADAHRMAYE